MCAMGEREFDIVVFGAGGYTGSFVVEELVKSYGMGSTNDFTWAVAGQSNNELQSMLEEVSELTGKDCTGATKILADALDLPSLIKMASKCNVIITSVGPFRFLGENLVKACLTANTHLIEASGEVQYLLKMQLLYNTKAVEKGIYIVQACGAASVPADCGTIFLEQNFPGVLNSVEIFTEYSDPKKAKCNYASYRSIIYINSQRKERDILEALVNNGPKLPIEYPLKYRGFFHYNRDVQRWCQCNPQCDKIVLERSQQLLYEAEGKHPVQSQVYLVWANIIVAAIALPVMLFIIFLCSFDIFRPFIEKRPKLFSLGSCNPDKKIPREFINSAGFKFTIIGRGSAKKLPETLDRHADTITRRLEVSGYNPMYGASAVMLIQAALTVMTEKDKMFGRGGVLPPGAAFAKTTFIERINARGILFKILPDTDS